MSHTYLRAAAGLALLTLLLTPLAVLAHEKIDAGNYIIEYGWLNEPPTAGQPNAIVLNIFGAHKPDAHELEGAIKLVAPANGSTVQGDELDVTIAIEGIDEHEVESLHWHLKVDEKSLLMAPLDQTTVTVTGLSNGAHTVEVAIALADHDEIGEAARAGITVEGSAATGEPKIEGFTDTEGDPAHASEDLHLDLSALKAELVYGGQTYPLILQPKDGGEPGEYVADFTPERPGLYTLRLSGNISSEALGDTEVNAEVEPEEVVPASDSAATTTTPTGNESSSTTAILVVAGLGILIAGLAVGVLVATRRR